MSYSNMNAKYSSVEDTVVSKNHVMSSVQLPNLSSKYQILSGTCSPLALTTAPTGNAVATPPLNILDDNGKQLYIPAGSYIEKVIVSPKSALTASNLSTSALDVQLAYRPSTSSGYYVNALPATPSVAAASLLSLINTLATSNALATTTAGSGLVAADSLVPGTAQTGTIINQGVVAFPDVVLSASSVNNYPVGVVSGGAFTGGEVRVTMFVVCP